MTRAGAYRNQTGFREKRERKPPWIEALPTPFTTVGVGQQLSLINEAFACLESGKARYRIVLDADF